jgi:hypothetical protein
VRRVGRGIGIGAVLAAVLACGGEPAATGPDASYDNGRCHAEGGSWCFVPPEGALSVEGGERPDLDCDHPPLETSSGEVVLGGVVKDWMTGHFVPGATVSAYYDRAAIHEDTPAATSEETDADGRYELLLPAPVPERIALGIRTPHHLWTIFSDVQVDVERADQERDVGALSDPGWTNPISVVRTVEGTGNVMGRVGDCRGRGVNEAIVTLSHERGHPAHLESFKPYYLAGGSAVLPQKRSRVWSTQESGIHLFVIVEVPVEDARPPVYLQAWGFLDEADVALGQDGLRLVGEVAIPAVPDAFVVVDVSPHRSVMSQPGRRF